jgi:hypothetical protein
MLASSSASVLRSCCASLSMELAWRCSASSLPSCAAITASIMTCCRSSSARIISPQHRRTSVCSSEPVSLSASAVCFTSRMRLRSRCSRSRTASRQFSASERLPGESPAAAADDDDACRREALCAESPRAPSVDRPRAVGAAEPGRRRLLILTRGRALLDDAGAARVCEVSENVTFTARALVRVRRGSVCKRSHCCHSAPFAAANFSCLIDLDLA